MPRRASAGIPCCGFFSCVEFPANSAIGCGYLFQRPLRGLQVGGTLGEGELCWGSSGGGRKHGAGVQRGSPKLLLALASSGSASGRNGCYLCEGALVSTSVQCHIHIIQSTGCRNLLPGDGGGGGEIDKIHSNSYSPPRPSPLKDYATTTSGSFCCFVVEYFSRIDRQLRQAFAEFGRFRRPRRDNFSTIYAGSIVEVILKCRPPRSTNIWPIWVNIGQQLARFGHPCPLLDHYPMLPFVCRIWRTLLQQQLFVE